MDIQDKHRVTLLNAKCEVVCKVQSMLKKMEYGEDISCCKKKLYVAIKLINRLDCYCFTSDSFNTLTTGVELINANKTVSIAEGIYYLYSGSQIISTYELIGVGTNSSVVEQLLNLAGMTYIKSALIETTDRFTITTDCDENDLSVWFNGSEYLASNITLLPTCETVTSECFNCIEDSDLSKMYELLSNLLK